MPVIARADRMTDWFSRYDRDVKGWYICCKLNEFDEETSICFEVLRKPVNLTEEELELRIVGVTTLVETLDVYRLVVEHCKLTKTEPTEFIALAFLQREATDAAKRALEMFSVVYKYS